MSERVRSSRKNRTKSAAKWIIAIVSICAAAAVVPLVKYTSGEEWGSDPMLATYIGAAFLVVSALVTIVVIKTVRTRFKKERAIQEQPEVNEYVILWNYPRWALYLPSVVLALLAGTVTVLVEHEAFHFPLSTMGGIMLAFVFLNLCVEQFHLSVKTLLIIVLAAATALLVLHLSALAPNILRFLRNTVKVKIPAAVYFFSVFSVAFVIFIGWLKGLFNYIAITPNTADLQRGATESGEHILTKDYNIQLDTSDFVERWIFGFGRVILTFRDRPPLTYFVPRASKIAEKIGRVRAVMAIDRSEGLYREAPAETSTQDQLAE
jgi:hypothetical protein